MKTRDMILRGFITAMTLSVLAPGVVMAQTRVTTQSAAARTMSFEEDEIGVELTRPDEMSFEVRSPGKTESLIKVRQDFIAELMASTSDVGL